MGESRLGDKARSRLIHLLSEDHPDPKAWMKHLAALRDVEGGAIFSDAVRTLFHLEMDDGEAEGLLRHVLEHRQTLTSRLGRDAGLRVAAMDYLTNVERRLLNPKIVEMEAYEATERSARTDPLTSLANRRVFDEVLDREVRRSRRYRLPLTLLLLDLDRFKDVNDAWGHLLGDLVLERVGDILRRTVREADVACRFGGEEFGVVLPETPRLGGYAVAERVRSAIERTFGEEPVGGHSIALTVSCGLASYPDDGLHASEIVSRADEALYGAKRAGRNRIGVRYRDKRSAVRFPAKPSVAVNLSRTGVLRVEEAPVSTGDEVRVSLSGFEATARVVRVERGPEGGTTFRVGAVFDSPLSDDVVLESVVTHAPGRPARGTSRR